VEDGEEDGDREGIFDGVKFAVGEEVHCVTSWQAVVKNNNRINRIRVRSFAPTMIFLFLMLLRNLQLKPEDG